MKTGYILKYLKLHISLQNIVLILLSKIFIDSLFASAYALEYIYIFIFFNKENI